MTQIPHKNQVNQQLWIKVFDIVGQTATIAFLAMTVIIPYLSTRPQHLEVEATATINSITLDLEVADTPGELSRGLKFRKELPQNGGMLFDLGKRHENVPFWMHQVKIPLDIIYLDNGVITHIAADSSPCNAISSEICPIYKAPSATHVIELNAGKTASLNLQVGDTILLE
ncbi:MAG: DUF192 domain-containing protein [Cyanobacteriota bacterium]|nr:DUF192 domain-containing protein [Cyanobacteriota bacterium]